MVSLKKSLNNFCNYLLLKLENIEKLEQLRAIDNGFKIAMVKVNSKSFGIDTQEDLNNAIKFWKITNLSKNFIFFKKIKFFKAVLCKTNFNLKEGKVYAL